MTAQPTVPISPQHRAPHGHAPAGFPHPHPPAPPAAPRRRTGRVVGIAIAALTLLAGLGGAALVVFGERTLEPESVRSEVVRITEEAVAVAPADVRCPDEIPARTGHTVTCTALVDGQPVTYSVRQDDDRGSLTIEHDRLIEVADLEVAVAALVGADVAVAVDVTCGPAGRTVLVNSTPGAPIPCTATNAADADDSAAVTVTVAADGTPSYAFA
jgi:hypothetical protein